MVDWSERLTDYIEEQIAEMQAEGLTTEEIDEAVENIKDGWLHMLEYDGE